MLAVLLGLALAAAPASSEPHPFAPENQALDESILRGWQERDPGLEKSLQQLLAAALGAAESVRWARELGVSEPYFEEIESQSRIRLWLYRGGLLFGVAALVIGAGLGIIALAGLALSRAQIRSLVDVHANLQSSERTPAEARVDRLYAAVLWGAVLLLFAALPVLLALTLALGAGLIWVMVSMKFVLLKLVALVGIGTLIALYGLARGLFVRRRSAAGRRLTRTEEPRLYALLDEVAKHARSRPVDEVILQPGSDVGVYEDGSTITVLSGRGTRVLALGFGALQQLTVGELCAVLAHEYGHFSHGETRLTPVLARVEASSIQMLQGMAASGQLVLINPAFWFLRGYVRVYLRITRGQGRRRELLADRLAALTYGGDTFGRALIRVSEASEDLSRAVVLVGVLRALGVESDTVYQLQDLKRQQTAAPLRAALNAERAGRPPGPYDTHPPDSERIARVAGVRGSRRDDTSPAMSLLSMPEKAASELAAEVAKRLPDPDREAPRPVHPAGEVIRALSAVQDASGSNARGVPGALAMLETAIESLTLALGPEHPFLVDQFRELAEARKRAGDGAGAEAAKQRATAIEEAGAARRRAANGEHGPPGQAA